VSVPATKLDVARGELAHYQATFLKDGRHFLCTALSSPQAEPITVLASIDDPSSKTITTGRNPIYVRSHKNGKSYLIYSRRREIVAQPFDPKRLELTGEPFRLAQTEDIIRSTSVASVSDTGVFVTVSGAGLNLHQPTWIERSGEARPAGPAGVFRQPRFSADEKTVLIEKIDGEPAMGDLWMLDSERGALSRLLGERDWWEYAPIWSPDNSEIIYSTNKNNRHTVVRRRLRDGVETSVYSSVGVANATDWSQMGSTFCSGIETRVWILSLAWERPCG